MGVDVAEGDQPESRGTSTGPRADQVGSHLRTVRLEGLVLLDSAATEPVPVEAILFADDGIGVIHNRGERPRVLPWSALTAHAVERWVGGPIPDRWLHRPPDDPRPEPWAGPTPAGPAPAPPTPPAPRVAAGALIGIQTSYGTYRFLYPGGDPVDLSQRVTAFAVLHQGPTAASTVTRVVTWGQDVERRQARRAPAKPAGWTRVQPYVVAAALVVVAVVVTLILLQSAGTIHLPLLGGSGSGSGAAATGNGARTAGLGVVPAAARSQSARPPGGAAPDGRHPGRPAAAPAAAPSIRPPSSGPA